MEVHVRAGADETGRIRAIDVYTLSNTGAFGEHGPTTVGLPDTSPFRFMERQTLSVFSTMWFIRT